MKNLIILIALLNSIIVSSQKNADVKQEFWKLLSENKFETIYKNQQIYLDKLQSDNSKEKLGIMASIQYVNQQFLDYEKALSLEERIYNDIILFYTYESIEMQDHLSRLSQIYTSISDFEKLKMIEYQNIDVSLKVFGTNSSEYSQACLNYSTTLTDLDEFSDALKMNSAGYQIALKLNNEELMIQGLINYGRAYFKLDDFEKSRENYILALNMIENSKKDFSSEYQIILSNLIGVYLKLGDHSRALHCSQLSISIRKELYGINNEKYAISILNNANIYYSSTEYNKAIKEYLKAKKIFDVLELNHTYTYYTLLNNISMCYNELGNYKKALSFLKQAKNIVLNLLGTDNLENLRLNSNLASILVRQGYNSEFIDTLLSYLKFGCDFYLNRRIGLSSHEQIALKNIIVNQFYILLSNSKDLNKNNLSDFYSCWINYFGIVNTDWKLLQNENIMNSNSTIQFEKLFSLKQKHLIYLESENFNSYVNGNLKNEIDFIEREISELLGLKSKKVHLSDILKQIDSNSVLIDIINFSNFKTENFQWTDSLKYAVFISNSKDTVVDFLILENGTELENELFTDYKAEISDLDKRTNLKKDVYYNSFWKPIAEKIGDAKTVYVSLGGVYNNINLNTLYNPETGKYLIEEKDIRIVNSARDFVLNKECDKKQYTSTTSALFGFPDYNGNTTSSADTTDYLAATRDLNQIWIDSLTRGGLKASPLPATKIEVEQITGTFQKNGWKVTTYTEENASETNIKKEVSPRVLHVATHGYFFEDIPFDTVDNRFLGMDRNRVVQDPMLRSGLLFTGANKTLQGEESKGENGLLSAAEASLLDLRETELVVLSACETGKGEVKNSEGVYGLRKAFADAGAENIIMSLWKVDDKVTQEFMTRFYEIWLNDKTSIREAFNRTQLEIKAKYPQPYYWGAFILVGE